MKKQKNTSKKPEPILKKNVYKLSEGNLKVLSLMPLIMQELEYRNKIRYIVREWIIEQNMRRNE